MLHMPTVFYKGYDGDDDGLLMSLLAVENLCYYLCASYADI